MDKMNIAFFTDTYLPAVDGVVISIKNFAEELQRRGHKVYIFASGDSKQKTDDSIKVFFSRGIKFKKYPQYTLAMFPFLSSLKVKKLDIDILHAQTPFTMGLSAMMIAKTNKIPLVGSFHTLFTDKAVIKEYAASNPFTEKVVTKYSWSYARFFYNKCDTVIAPSASTQKLLIKENIQNTTVVENGVDKKIFNTDIDAGALRSRLLIKKRDKLVLYVGRISKEKKIGTLIKAAHYLKDRDITFVIVGNGPALKHYKNMANIYGLNNIRFTGFVKNTELPKYYSASDTLCIPSTFETQGIVCVEAMACGKPVVGANYMALHELIKDGRNGEKFSPQSSVDCAKKIEKVLNNADRYNTVISTADNYSVEKTTDKLLKVYKSLLS